MVLGASNASLLLPLQRAKCFKHMLDNSGIVLLVPPAATFARVRHSNHHGSQPVRDNVWPRGRPKLSAGEMKKVDEENVIAEFSIELANAAAQAGSTVCLLFPEDLGSMKRGTPASLWQWPAVRRATNGNLQRGAVFQGDWTQLDSPRPLGILTNAAKMLEHKLFFLGWPAFLDGGKYTGPLPQPSLQLPGGVSPRRRCDSHSFHLGVPPWRTMSVSGGGCSAGVDSLLSPLWFGRYQLLQVGFRLWPICYFSRGWNGRL